jgi:hypothetical protein
MKIRQLEAKLIHVVGLDEGNMPFLPYANVPYHFPVVIKII